jgi:hypothetical protein
VPRSDREVAEFFDNLSGDLGYLGGGGWPLLPSTDEDAQGNDRRDGGDGEREEAGAERAARLLERPK